MKTIKLSYFSLIVSCVFILLSCSNEPESYSNEPEEKKPEPKFSYINDGLLVIFSNKTNYAQSYHWDFGDGYTSTEKNPKHTYSSYGKYKVTLTATNITETNSISEEIVLSEKLPIASFSYKIEQPLKVVFTNSSSNASAYLWDFGDGTTSNEKFPTHRYKGIGVYRVKLTAKSANRSNTQELNIKVEAPTICLYSGLIFNKIPNNNYYYQIQVTDDYIFSKTTYSYTDWFLLSSANIPYTVQFKKPKELSISKSYVVRLYKSSTKQYGQADGKGTWTADITSQKLKTYPESLTYSNSSTSITINFQWK